MLSYFCDVLCSIALCCVVLCHWWVSTVHERTVMHGNLWGLMFAVSVWNIFLFLFSFLILILSLYSFSSVSFPPLLLLPINYSPCSPLHYTFNPTFYSPLYLSLLPSPTLTHTLIVTIFFNYDFDFNFNFRFTAGRINNGKLAESVCRCLCLLSYYEKR